MSAARKVLLVTHTRRPEALAAALETCQKLVGAGIVPVMLAADHSELLSYSLEQAGAGSTLPAQIELLERDCALTELEVAMVLGGDGTILKAAEIVREAEVPLVGINLGHVGFLAESERDGLAEAVERVVAKDYVVKERMTLDVRVFVEGKEVFQTWADRKSVV